MTYAKDYSDYLKKTGKDIGLLIQEHFYFENIISLYEHPEEAGNCAIIFKDLSVATIKDLTIVAYKSEAIADIILHTITFHPEYFDLEVDHVIQ